ncbi:type II toxin-antitoxin system Phd/YefM family antitoxin [Microbacterium sp. NIBRBAC000506063]|uniref:type II toxin-antitoxin system Phd/YefM family antitoxin n=1 Tax=Microbacterium sp. NIBRBAC000506063 TaxID=2734618 RepID=UPI001BB58A45|nr:type II toxin-antitoxin system prevent-host-death family antitoxin [Microbacterium sp. NIBRBAC000506063]
MRTISQRELRNESGEIMRQVQRGAQFRVTSRGTPIAVLAPIGRSVADELALREGTQRMVFPRGISSTESTESILAELRGDR